jgi:PAS domain S-box-containing protein
LLSLSLTQVTEHAIALMDSQGRIVGWFAGAEAMFGYTAQEMTGNLDVFSDQSASLNCPRFL